jgi:ubiquinol-cytochrome c reductase cytochrome b subunit
MLGKVKTWITDRFGYEPVRQHVLERRVPKTPWYYGDGATLLLLLTVQIVTGGLMALTYSPSPDSAYQSVQHITQQQMLGWFVRGMHYWSAGLMVVMIFAHVLRVVLVGGYKQPREGTWLIGVTIFFLVMVMAFTGYVLRWDERGIHALLVALHMFQRVPIVGEWLIVLVQGGGQIGSQTLTRIYAVHVILVPLLLLGLVGWHLYLVIYKGVTAPAERRQPVHTAQQQREIYKAAAHSDKEGESFYPFTSAKSGLMAAAVLALAVALTITGGPAALQPQANLVSPAFPAEEWWFWWYSGLIALLPPWLAPAFYVLFPLALLALMASLPFVDRNPHRAVRKRPIVAACVVVIVLALLYLTDFRRRSPFTAWPSDQPPPVPVGVVLAPEIEQGRQLFAVYGCNTCHPVAGYGPQVGTDMAAIRGRYSQAELRGYILHPPPGVPMPSYAGRLSDEDLERLVDFVLATQTFPFERR